MLLKYIGFFNIENRLALECPMENVAFTLSRFVFVVAFKSSSLQAGGCLRMRFVDSLFNDTLKLRRLLRMDFSLRART